MSGLDSNTFGYPLNEKAATAVLAHAPRFEIRLGEEGYPDLLAHISHPPQKLHGIGDVRALQGGLAVVGARKATPYGLECATAFASRAASCGIAIISGGAIGCDQAALRAGVQQNARCVFVAAGGPEVIYPKGATLLAGQLVWKGGAIVSEQTWGTAPLRGYFVARNRIIAGLAQATLVVEAGLPSGTFQTADAAVEAGREVWGVPGCIHSPQSRGTNQLIRDGAQVVADMDAFDALLTRVFGMVPNLMVGSRILRDYMNNLTPAQRALIDSLRACPSRVDEIAKNSALNQVETTIMLTEAEACGLVVRYPDGRYGVPLEPKNDNAF